MTFKFLVLKFQLNKYRTILFCESSGKFFVKLLPKRTLPTVHAYYAAAHRLSTATILLCYKFQVWRWLWSQSNQDFFTLCFGVWERRCINRLMLFCFSQSLSFPITTLHSLANYITISCKTRFRQTPTTATNNKLLTPWKIAIVELLHKGIPTVRHTSRNNWMRHHFQQWRQNEWWRQLNHSSHIHHRTASSIWLNSNMSILPVL